MKIVFLTGSKIHSLEDFKAELQKQLTLPPSVGCNLDAFWDVLTTDVEGPFEIKWAEAQISQHYMGRKFGALIQLLREVEQERPDFRFSL